MNAMTKGLSVKAQKRKELTGSRYENFLESFTLAMAGIMALIYVLTP